MDFLIFSDSHGRGTYVREVLDRQIVRPDGIFFAGDGLRDLDRVDFDGIPVYAVQGNCDIFSSFCTPEAAPLELTVPIGDHSVFLTHGHLYGAKSGVGSLISRAVQKHADIVLFGHTHRPYLERIEVGTVIGETQLSRPLYLFNPGSLGMEKSFGCLTVRGDSILLSHGEL